MPEKDYYATLELTPEASEADIKQAYRKMAVKWHPDKNPDNPEEATMKFKEISEAYSVLSDPQKRRRFDQDRATGTPATGGARPSTSFVFRDPFELFNTVFKDRDPFSEFLRDPSFGSPFSFTRRTAPTAAHSPFPDRDPSHVFSPRRSAASAQRTSSTSGSFLRLSSLFDDDDFIRGFGSFGKSRSFGTLRHSSRPASYSSLGSGTLFASPGARLRRVPSRTVTTVTHAVGGETTMRQVTTTFGAKEFSLESLSNSLSFCPTLQRDQSSEEPLP